MIEVRLFASFRQGREKVLFLNADAFDSTRKVVDHLEIPAEEVAILLINGRHSKLDDSLKDEDIVALFPPVGGG